MRCVLAFPTVLALASCAATVNPKHRPCVPPDSLAEPATDRVSDKQAPARCQPTEESLHFEVHDYQLEPHQVFTSFSLSGEEASAGDPAAAQPARAETTEAAAPSGSPSGTTPLPSPGGKMSLRGAIGFTLDPDTFLMAFEADFSATKEISLGPLLQLGVTDDRTIVAPSLNVQYVFDLSGLNSNDVMTNDLAKKLKPFAQGGLGVVYIHKDGRRGNNVDDVGFFLNLGGGIEYYLTEKFAIGNNLLFNILPEDIAGEHFFFSWQFVTARYHF